MRAKLRATPCSISAWNAASPFVDPFEVGVIIAIAGALFLVPARSFFIAQIDYTRVAIPCHVCARMSYEDLGVCAAEHPRPEMDRRPTP